jgi:enediyne core biosynthesis thioesterase
MPKHYEYRHIVCFEDTNLVGNVYYANHIRWQGRCRELFLRDHAPEVLGLLERGELALVTLSVSCDYLGELVAFDEVLVRMTLEEQVQHKIAMRFEYFKQEGTSRKLVAQGRQEIGCMARNPDSNKLTPVPLPASLRQALEE